MLVVGIDGYKDPKIKALEFAERDASDVYGFFATDPRSPADEDRVLALYGKDATRAAVRRSIREHLARRARDPGDMAILYFAGHGFTDQAGKAHLACYDTELADLEDTALTQKELAELWGSVTAGHKLLLVDACHAGSLENVRGSFGAPEIVPRAAVEGSVVVTATASGEVSVEDPRLRHGVFTLGLLNGLRGGALDGSGVVTAESLGRYLKDEVPRLAGRLGGIMTPVVQGAGGFAVTRAGRGPAPTGVVADAPKEAPAPEKRPVDRWRRPGLAVTSKPAGARVILDDRKEAGRTPLDLDDLPPGKHRLAFALDGFEECVKDVELRSGERLDVAADLEPFTGALTVESKVAAAKVEVRVGDAKLTAETAKDGTARFAKVPVGAARVTVAVKGFESASVDATIERKKEARVTAALAERPGAIFVRSAPSGLQASLDGVSIGFTPARKEPVAAGEHDVSVVDEKGATTTKKVVVHGEETAVCVLDLAGELRSAVLVKLEWTRAALEGQKLEDALVALKAFANDYGSDADVPAWPAQRLKALEEQKAWSTFLAAYGAERSAEKKVQVCDEFLTKNASHPRAQEARELRAQVLDDVNAAKLESDLAAVAWTRREVEASRVAEAVAALDAFAKAHGTEGKKTNWIPARRSELDKADGPAQLPGGLRLGQKVKNPDGKEIQVYLWKLPGDAGDMELVYVPRGDFVMGTDDSDAYDEEKPKRTEKMDHGFWIGRHDVTWKQYLAFCDATGHAKPEAPSWGIKEDHPVSNVSWDDLHANAGFLSWTCVALPSEAEWEKAARGTDGRKWPWGNEAPTKELCNFNNTGSTSTVTAHPNGASPYGALDMAGNVWQWCEDLYPGGSFRVFRGGSWYEAARSCVSSHRMGHTPDFRDNNVGFRVVLRSIP